MTGVYGALGMQPLSYACSEMQAYLHVPFVPVLHEATRYLCQTELGSLGA